MGNDVELGCRCGKIHGVARDLLPRKLNRIVCYCDDCQAYLHYLGRADLFEPHSGTDIVQVAPSAVTFDRGLENIVGLRLVPKGLHRWYANCCKTPLGNTVTPSIPFIGMPMEVFRDAQEAHQRSELFGPVRALSLGKFATDGAPEGSTHVHLGMIAHAARLVLTWKLLRKTWPHPFFNQSTQAPIYPVTILSATERDALRPKCGPNPKDFGTT